LKEKEELEKTIKRLTKIESQLHEKLDNVYLNHSFYVSLRISAKKIDDKY
jgi:hypothetical protein